MWRCTKCGEEIEDQFDTCWKCAEAGPVMWRCTKCGEEIEDQFDACWKCAEAGPVERDQPARQPEASWFFRYWRRGWLILFVTALVGLGARFLVYVLSEAAAYGEKLVPEGRPLPGPLLPLLALALGVLALPVWAYFMFVIFFGDNAWLWSSKPGNPAPQETAFALFEEGARLEARGNVQDALDAYTEVVKDYPDTPAAQDARKSIESLRSTPGTES